MARPDPRGPAAGWLLLLWTTLAALWIAAGGFGGWHLLVEFVVGTFLMRSAMRRQTNPPHSLLIINMNTAKAIGLNVPEAVCEDRELAE